jgi:ring-1,2-phenylacetyl-CoA epoxidase subunit PaaC
MTPEFQSAKFTYLTRLGDSALVLSHRLAEWCGKGPALEEDMALANTALDLLGHARMWLSYAAEIEGRGRDEDALAYLRSDREFRNMLLVERPNGDYADTMVRQFFFDVWHRITLNALAFSTDPRIAEIAVKGAKEVTYHVRRSADLLVRMGDGTAISHRLAQKAVDDLWPYTGEFFMADRIDQEIFSAGEGVDPQALHEAWMAVVKDVLGAATLAMPSANVWMHEGGKQGIHSEHLGFLLAEMQVLPRSYPGAKW